VARVAELLHDAIEDVGAEQEAAIAERFGPRVAGIVRACTDADIRPRPPWRARKEAYIAHLEHAYHDALLVSRAYKLHNARAIVADLRTHGLAVSGGFAGTIWYYATLGEVFSRLLPSPLSAELELAVGDMQRLVNAGSGA
jgi:GTP pyrophosphokinase